MQDTIFCTYTVASRSRTLYIGMTSNLEHRVWEHKNKIHEGFSAIYNCDRSYGSRTTQTRKPR